MQKIYTLVFLLSRYWSFRTLYRRKSLEISFFSLYLRKEKHTITDSSRNIENTSEENMWPLRTNGAHLQKTQGDWILLQQKAKQCHPLANEFHYFLLCRENVGGLFLIGALWELSLVGGWWLKSSTHARFFEQTPQCDISADSFGK